MPYIFEIRFTDSGVNKGVSYNLDLICGESSKYLEGAVFAYFNGLILCIE